MRVAIIGGAGHVGTYLVPRLVEAGHEVINITRGQREPYQAHAAWKSVQQVIADRAADDRAGTFGRRIRDLRPDVVIDMICFTEASARQLVESLKGEVQHFLHCGTIWVHGPTISAPLTEQQPRRPFGEYGIHMRAITQRSVAIGESFHVVSPAALTLRGYAQAVAAWFGRSAQLRFLPWEDWKKIVPTEEAEATWDHITHSPCCSIAKAERLLNYQPRYSSLQAIHEALDWMIQHRVIQLSS